MKKILSLWALLTLSVATGWAVETRTVTFDYSTGGVLADVDLRSDGKSGSVSSVTSGDVTLSVEGAVVNNENKTVTTEASESRLKLQIGCKLSLSSSYKITGIIMIGSIKRDFICTADGSTSTCSREGTGPFTYTWGGTTNTVVFENNPSGGNQYITSIRVSYEYIPEPSLTFTTPSPSVEILSGDNSASYTNILNGAPTGSTVTWSIVDAGNTGATINSSTGEVTVTAPGSCLVRATTSATDEYAASYAEYTLTVTQQTLYEYTVSFNNGTYTQTPAGSEYFSVGGTAFGSEYAGTYNGTTYANACKVSSTFATSFTVAGTATVTIVQCISRASDDNGPLKFDNTALPTASTSNCTVLRDDTNGYIEYTLTNVAAGTYEVKRGSGQTGIFFIKVVDSELPKSQLAQFAFIPAEVVLHNGTTSYTYVNDNTFVYDADHRTLRTKLIISPDYTEIGADLTSEYFDVVSSNTAVLNPAGFTVRKPSDQRLYFDDIAMGEVTSTDQTVTLTFKFLGSDTYAPTEVQVPITIKVHNPVTYRGVQPHTWDFENSDWTNTQLQVNYGYSIWTVTENEARPTSVTQVPAYNKVDMIHGLAFTTTYPAGLCLDWANKQVWMDTDGTIAIPDLSIGQTVTITSINGNNFAIASDSPATGTIAGNVITMTSAGTLKVRLTAPTYIKCIAVAAAVASPFEGTYTDTSTNLYDDEDETTVSRPTTGTFTFTTTGAIAGGTVLNEVPGLSVTVGAPGDNTWSVVDATALDGSYNLGNAAAYCNTGPNRPTFTSGCFYVFNPTVNGEVSIHYYTTSGLVVYDTNGKANNSAIYNPTDQRIRTFSFKVIAGETYWVSGRGGSIYLHSYSFTPMFFDPVTGNAYTNSNLVEASHDQNDPFVATSATPVNMYPKMIVSDAQAGTARFAGNKDVVYLYNNNNVELVGYSDATIIRGRVYAAAPNDDRQLNAWYYLHSNVLQLNSTQLNSTAIADKEYVSNPGGADNNYVFTFNQNITLSANASVKVRKDAGDAQAVTAYVSGASLYIPLGTLDDGATYTITMAAGSVSSSEDNTLAAAEITRIFTVNAAGELSLNMIYPTTTATVGTRIVLKSQLMDNTSKQVTLDKNYPAPLSSDDEATGHLVGRLYKVVDGTETWVEDIVATYTVDKLSFKPSQVLDANSTYTLKVSANLDQSPQYQVKGEVDKTVYYVKHDKAFTFKTGTVSGTAPLMSSSSPYDGQRCTVSELPVNSPTFTVTFDQNITVEDGTIINVRPVNGSEALSDGEFYVLTDEFGASSLTVNGNQLTFTGGNEGLRYDLWHELVIPAGSIVGTGGTPNTSDITIKFKVDKNPEATQEVSYPYTWDFERISAQTVNTTIADIETNSTFWQANKSLFGEGKFKNALKKGAENSCVTYKSDNSNNGRFDQGNNIYVINSSDGTKTYLNEFYGLRISLKKSQNPRFEIRDLTSESSDQGPTNADGSRKYVFRMNGNTHYLTIPDMPKGEFYMVTNTHYLGINSPNAYVDMTQNTDKLTVIKGYNDEDDKAEVVRTNGTTSVKIVVTQAGDVSFCVKNFNLAQIAVPIVTDKYISAAGYATDSWTVPVRYDLTKTMTGKDVKGMFIKSADASGNAYTTASTVVTLSPVKATLNGVLKDDGPKVATPGAGTILKGGQGSYALFTADVNSLPDNTMDEGDNTNLLIGSGDEPLIVGNSSGSTNDYIFSNVYYSVNENGEIIEGTSHQGLGFRLVAAGLSEADRTLAPHKSYLHLPSGAAAGAASVSMMLLNLDTNVLNAITEIQAADVVDGIGNGDDMYYTLSGVKISKPTQKGIYIKNGKKYYVK